MRVREAVDFADAGRPTSEAGIFIQRSGLVADEMAEFRQCNGVTGPWVNSRLYTQRDADVTGEMAEFCGCDAVTGGWVISCPAARKRALVRLGRRCHIDRTAISGDLS